MKTKIILAAVLAAGILCVMGNVNAGIIVDRLVEQSDTSWASSSGWGNTGWAAVLSPVTQEGTTMTHTNQNGRTVSNADLADGAHTLQEGSYTIYFSSGNFSNAPAAWITDTYSLDFAGLTETDVISKSDVTAPSKGWTLWSFTWDVASDNPNIGNPLSFSITTNVEATANGAIDGVGGQSELGTGFLVNYVQVPEPSSMLLMLLGLVGLGVSRRRSK